MKCLASVHALFLFCVFAGSWPCHAVTQDGTQWPINLGITGVRAHLKPDAPKTLVVAEVLPNTPAAGRIKVGDRIVGVNGKLFATAHTFGYGMDKFGYEGPMMDVGNALEQSQGSRLNGDFNFLVADGSQPKTVELRLPMKYGQFAKTFPFNCQKTDRILAELYASLIQSQNANGSWSGRPHLNAFAALALLASGEKQYMPAVKRAVEAMAKSTENKIEKSGALPNWRYTLYGMVLAEYYLATGEKWVLPELEEIRTALQGSQFMVGDSGTMRDGKPADKQFGGWGHNPNYEGYGPIGIITGQGLAAYGLMRQCGVAVDDKNYNDAAAFLARGTNSIGYVWYADGGANNNGYADMGRTGISAVAHAVSTTGGKPFLDAALLNARCIGNHPKTFIDTHGSPILGIATTALGAAVDPDAFRKLMDYHVWFFNLAQNANGTYYYQPNRDSNPQDYGPGNDLPGTAVIALVLSIKHKSLRMMGAKVFIEGVNPSRLSRYTHKPFELIGAGRFVQAHQELISVQAKLGGEKTPVEPEKANAPEHEESEELRQARAKLLALGGGVRRSAPARSRGPVTRSAIPMVEVSTEEDLQTIAAMLTHIDKQLATVLDRVKQLNAGEDMVALEEAVDQYSTIWDGIPQYDQLAKPILASLKSEPRKTTLRLGKEYRSLIDRMEKRPNATNLRALTSFGENHKDHFYGARALESAEELESLTSEGRKKYFETLREKQGL